MSGARGVSLRPALVGIFVGGASSRMGGRAKGLLRTADGTPIVQRTAKVAAELGLRAVLVGRRPEYSTLALETIDDDPSLEGPLAGLASLLDRASREGAHDAVVIGCDMPFVTASLLARLARHAPGADAVAPREEGHWSPFFARYRADAVAPQVRAVFAAGRRSMRSVLEAVGAAELPTSGQERATLRDWDRPEDVGPATDTTSTRMTAPGNEP